MSQPPERQEKGALNKDVIIEGHVYDGIQEYDNPMPGWWLAIFYVTIAWALIYTAGISLGFIDGYDRQLKTATSRISEIQFAAAANATPIDEAVLIAALDNMEARERGAATFAVRCAMCHGEDGTGGIGADLTDETWIHGGEPAQIYNTISNGVLDKGMPAHSFLGEEELIGLVAFVKNL